jgi:hypothetical protein
MNLSNSSQRDAATACSFRTLQRDAFALVTEDEISSVIQAMPSCKALQKSTGTIDVKFA